MNLVNMNFQLACLKTSGLPNKFEFQKWLNYTFRYFKRKSEVTIRIVDEVEIHELNLYYRNENTATDILAFSFANAKDTNSIFLGDLVLCRQIIESVAKDKHLPLKTHWAHVVIHGSLHLLGYTHNDTQKREEMELIEKNIMLKIQEMTHSL